MQGALATCAATKIIGGTTGKIKRIAIADDLRLLKRPADCPQALQPLKIHVRLK
jgi:hypothetical protein